MGTRDGRLREKNSLHGKHGRAVEEEKEGREVE